MDASAKGVLVGLKVDAFGGDSAVADAMSLLRRVERHFTSGVEVRFPREDVRVRASVVRLVAPQRAGGEQLLGCEFLRPLTLQELARILHEEEPEALDAPLPFELAPRAALLVSVYDSTTREAGKTLATLDLLAAGPEALDGRVTAPAGATCEGTMTLLDRGAMPARIEVRRVTLWEGPVRVLATRSSAGAPTEVLARFTTLRPLGASLAKHLRARSG